MPVETPSNSRAVGLDPAGAVRVRRPEVGHARAATSILFVANPTAYGGTEKHLLELIRRIREPAKVSLLCVGLDVFSERMTWPGAEKISVRCEVSPTSMWGWFRLFTRNRADVVMFVHNWVDAFTWDVPVAAKLAGIPRLVAIHQLLAPQPASALPVKSPATLLRWMFSKRRLRLLRSRLSASIARTTTICVSDAVRERLISMYGFAPDRTITIYNGVEPSEFAPDAAERDEMRARLGLTPSDFAFVFVGRLSEQKGVDVLLNALSKTLRDGTCCKCLIVGEGPLWHMLTEQASRLGLSNSVHFLGFQQDPRPFLQAADAFVLTSHFEGLPLSVLEAMACGLPCVVTDAAGNREAVADKLNGFVVPLSAVDEISAAMSYLVANPSEAARMAKESRVRATEIFDMDTLMAKIEHVLLGTGTM
jgi:glycosyltransferase involved in cell wall biosynthesis